MGRLRLPRSLRRGLESGIFSGLVATTVLLGHQLRAEGAPIVPSGLGASFLFALPVISIGVIAVAYPVALAATRSEAILGALVGFLVAADIAALIADGPVAVGPLDGEVRLGLLAALLAIPPAGAGIFTGLFASPLGFGPRAGAAAAVGGAIAATVVLVMVPALA